MQQSKNVALVERSSSSEVSSVSTAHSESQHLGYARASYGASYWDSRSGNLSGLLVMLRRRKLLILSTAVAVFLLALAYCLFADRLYTAETTLEIRGYAPVLQEAEIENSFGRDTRRIEYSKTTMSKLKQLVIADKALARDGLAQDVERYLRSRAVFWRQWVNKFKQTAERLLEIRRDRPKKDPVPPFQHSEQQLRSYLGLIDTSPINQTSLVEISVTTGIPKLSQKIANTHAEVFIEHLRQERQQELQQNLAALEQHSAELRQQLLQIEEAIAKYAREQQLVALPNSRDENLTAKNISDLKALLADATARRIKSESMLSEIETGGSNSATMLDDEVIHDLKSQLEKTRAHYEALLQKTTALYPPVIELKAKMDSLERSIQQAREQRRRALAAQYGSDLTIESKLAEQVEKERSTANEMSAKLVQYNLLLREAESLRSLSDAVAKELKQTQISAASSKSNIYVSDHAALPSRHSSPKVKFILTVSVILGFGLGLAFALLAELLNNKITCSEDAQQSLGLAPLGSLPSFSRFGSRGKAGSWAIPLLGRLGLPYLSAQTSTKTGSPDSPASSSPSVIPPIVTPRRVRPLVAVTAPQAAVSEALRTIRAAVLFSSADHPARVLLVTSSGKSDGKTTVATNLAVTLAQASYRTLLIDADLRAPNASWYFGIPPSTIGLADFLTGHAPVEDIEVATGVALLSVIPAGSSCPNPAELVGSMKFAEMLPQLSSRFDFVIIDSPPIIPVADGLMLSRNVDGVLFVVRSEKTERPRAQEAVRRLRRVGARMLGVVVNDVARNGNIYSVDREIYAYDKMFKARA